MDGDLANGIVTCIGVLIAFGAFAAIGRIIPGRRFWEYPLIGWAIAYLLSVIAALVGIHSLRHVVAATAVLAVVTLIWRRPTIKGAQYFPVLAAVPLLALSLLTPPVFVDSYSHWLPNAAYIYQLDRFPETPLGNFISLHPTYPYALPLVIYISSLVAGEFTELAGNVINAVLFLLAMGCIGQLLRDHFSHEHGAPGAGKRASLSLSNTLIAALAFCIAIPLNPAIEMQYYWSVIADPALAVLIFLTIAACARYMSREDPDRTGTSLAVLFAFGCVASGLKPNAWVLSMIIGVATGFVGIVHRVPLRRWLPPASVIVAGTLLSAFLWKVYLNRHLAIPDQFVVRALPDWSFELWDELLLAMLRILKTHTLYSTLVIATLAVGVASLVRRNLIANPTLRLMVGLVCVVMGLHVASLFAAYLGTGFEDWMITTASSFPRYTTQVGYAVCVTGLLMATTVLVPAVSAKLASVPPRRLAMASVLVCVVLFSAMTVRQTLALQDLVRERAHHREVALAALKNVPAGHRVVAAAPKWTLNYLRYVAWAELGPGERPSLVDGLMFYKSDDDCEANRVLANWMANPSIDAVLLVDADAYVKRCARNSSPDRIWWRLAGSWRSIQVPEDRG